jgi:hypothetical protein
MVEEKKVLFMKVDTLKNFVDSLKKSVRTENFSWCRGSMGIVVDIMVSSGGMNLYCDL